MVEKLKEIRKRHRTFIRIKMLFIRIMKCLYVVKFEDVYNRHTYVYLLNNGQNW